MTTAGEGPDPTVGVGRGPGRAHGGCDRLGEQLEGAEKCHRPQCPLWDPESPRGCSWRGGWTAVAAGDPERRALAATERVSLILRAEGSMGVEAGEERAQIRVLGNKQPLASRMSVETGSRA